MNPEQHVFFMPDGRRLTAVRVAGLGLEKAFEWVHSIGLFALQLVHVASVQVDMVAAKCPVARRSSEMFGVKDVHQQAILDAVGDILPRLHAAGYAIVGVIVPQNGYKSAHDLVLEYRQVDGKCNGQYSCELKLRTYPAKRELMRSDCAGLFQTACRESTKWLGQFVVVAEISSDGRFLRSRAELLIRDRRRSEAKNVWGWGGRPCVPPQRISEPVAPVLAPMRAAPSGPKRPWQTVWAELTKYDASWADERVVLLKDFFQKLGGRFKGKVKNCDRVVSSNRQDSRLQWRMRVHYGQANTRAEGRVKQGGAGQPYIVCKSALRVYYDTL